MLQDGYVNYKRGCRLYFFFVDVAGWWFLLIFYFLEFTTDWIKY